MGKEKIKDEFKKVKEDLMKKGYELSTMQALNETLIKLRT
jgi:hypothetical protein